MPASTKTQTLFQRYRTMCADRGLDVSSCRTAGDLAAVIHATGFHRGSWDAPMVYIRKYLGISAVAEAGAATPRQINFHRPKYQPKPHMRQAEISAATPPRFISMGGIGNGIERQNGFARGA